MSSNRSFYRASASRGFTTMNPFMIVFLRYFNATAAISFWPHKDKTSFHIFNFRKDIFSVRKEKKLSHLLIW